MCPHNYIPYYFWSRKPIISKVQLNDMSLGSADCIVAGMIPAENSAAAEIGVVAKQQYLVSSEQGTCSADTCCHILIPLLEFRFFLTGLANIEKMTRLNTGDHGK